MDIYTGNDIKRIDTNQFGVFKFQLGLSGAGIETILQRVQDAQDRFCVSPLASVATQLEKEVVVSSVFGTNTIEGGELSEQETEQALLLSPEQVQDIQQQRALNIKNAYDYIREVSVSAHWDPTIENVFEIHSKVYENLAEGEQNNARILRSNPDGVITRVGNEEHGGIYKPPQNGADIRLLLSELLAWNVALSEQGVPALIRAPLVHLYFEIIHPFWDGNGRVGRVLEAGILYADGFRYAPFAQASYYLTNIDKYFALFNFCRKAANKKHDFPNVAFVSFFLEGMLETINTLHDRVNKIVQVVLFETQLKNLHDYKKINHRQYAIVNEVLRSGEAITIDKIRQSIWYNALYNKLTAKTRSRDMKHLIDIGLLNLDDKGNILFGFVDGLKA